MFGWDENKENLGEQKIYFSPILFGLEEREGRDWRGNE